MIIEEFLTSANNRSIRPTSQNSKVEVQHEQVKNMRWYNREKSIPQWYPMRIFPVKVKKQATMGSLFRIL